MPLGHAAIIEQDEDTTIAANLIAGTIQIQTTFEKHHGSPEAVLVEAMWLLRDGRIRDGRSASVSAALLGAAQMLGSALSSENIRRI